MKKMFLMILVFVMMACLLTGCQKKKYALSEYIKYEIEGKDGEGAIYAKFDYRSFMSDAKISDKYRDDIKGFRIKISQEDGLANGDEVKLTVKYDKDIENKLHAEFTDTSIVIEVKDLEEKSYQEILEEILTEVTDMGEEITNKVTELQKTLRASDYNGYQSALQKLSEYATALKQKYQTIATVEPPKNLADQVEELKLHADNLCTMLDDSIELYTIAGESLIDDLTEEQIQRITELQIEIRDLNPSADEFDRIVSQIMDNK